MLTGGVILATAIEPAFITVSGYPRIPALSVFCGSRCVLTTESRTFTKQELTLAPVMAPQWLCQRCKQRRPRDTTDMRLGYADYCTPCVTELVLHCETKHGRLPREGREFFCAGCLTIHSLGELLTDNSQARWRCHACRKAQWRAARLRQHARLNGERSA